MKSSEMDETPVEEQAGMIPFEIRNAIEALAGTREQAIVVTLLEEDRLAFSELEETLDLHSQQLTNAIDALLEGGVVRKRSSEDPTERYQAHYEVTEYGERFVDCLLGTLGTVDSGERPDVRRQQIDHIHDADTGEPMNMSSYPSNRETSDSADRI